MNKETREIFTTGGVLVILGIIYFAQTTDLQGTFFLVGLGIVIMASSNSEWAQNVWELFFNFFKGLFSLITRK